MNELIPIQPGQRGRCPHCFDFVVFIDGREAFGKPAAGHGLRVAKAIKGSTELYVCVDTALCPSCERVVVDLSWITPLRIPEGSKVVQKERLYPVTSSRPKPPAEVPELLRRDYEEAAAVETLSPRSAAALARRCLQATLRDKGFKASRLDAEIELATKADAVSADLRKRLHIVRQVGNYAVHPIPDGGGGILEVEAGEVDALFDALDALFDALYVRPIEDAKRLEALNVKLKAAGKPPIT